MIYRQLVLILLFLTLVSESQASSLNEIKWKSSKQGLYFTILHSEAGQYFVDSFLIPPGQMQVQLNSIQFGKQDVALRHFRSETSLFSDEKPVFNAQNSTWTELNSRQIWKTEHQWNLDWEERYKDWITNEVTPDYLYKHNIAVDCADVPVSLRWIFARIHGLPMANQLAGSKIIFSNESFKVAWQDLPTHGQWHQDMLFLEALDYVLRHTYTHSLMDDLYPLEIHPSFMRAGTIFLNLYSERTGHTELIREIIMDKEHPAPLRTIASTVPRAVRILPEYGFRKWKGALTEDKHGFFSFRWPIQVGGRVSLLEAEKMPGYSLEQFESTFMEGYKDYLDAILNRILPGWAPNLRHQMKSLVSLILDKLHARVDIVEEGHEFCTQKPEGCQPNTLDWEAWSTPSRDSSIASTQADIDTLMNDYQCDSDCRSELTTRQNEVILSFGERALRLRHALYIWRNAQYSSDPNHSIRARWGR